MNFGGVRPLAAIPFTRGGLSVVAAAPVAALTVLEIAAIIAAASVGLALLIAVFKDYEEISYDNGKLVIKKRSKRVVFILVHLTIFLQKM